MDYYSKYLKYKIKYLNLKNNNIQLIKKFVNYFRNKNYKFYFRINFYSRKRYFLNVRYSNYWL